jgi:large subunit ribosomal protein L18
MNKKYMRIKRSTKIRSNVAKQSKPRLSVFKSNKNIYAQLCESNGSKIIVSASSNEKDNKLDNNNIESAKLIGKKIASRALDAGIKEVVFDRSGYIYITAKLKRLLSQQDKTDWCSNESRKFNSTTRCA